MYLIIYKIKRKSNEITDPKNYPYTASNLQKVKKNISIDYESEIK